MGKHDALAKSLAIIGTVLVALPLVAPLLTGLTSIGSPGGLRVDYLMPFEIYFVTVAGMVLLVWASFRAHDRKRAIGITIGLMLGALVLAAVAAQVTGIANSVEQLAAWKYILTATLGGLSLVAQLALIVEGSLLTRDLFASHEDTAPPLSPIAGA